MKKSLGGPIDNTVRHASYSLPMSNPNDIPCRVSADIRAHHARMNHAEPESFDYFDEDHMKQILPERLRDPIQQLLSTANQISMADAIGGLNKEKALEWLRQDVLKVLEGCRDQWKDL
jgi:hypothetical protein